MKKLKNIFIASLLSFCLVAPVNATEMVVSSDTSEIEDLGPVHRGNE